MSTALITKTSTLPVPVDSLDAYVQHVNSIPMLEANDEQDLARRLRLHDDLEAARKLILAHLRFVVHIARGYQGYGLALGDLIQEGNVGLMKAVKRFDPEHGVRLVSFAVHWIRAEIQEYILRNWRIVKVATTKAQRKLFFNLRSSKKRLGWMNAAEIDAMAESLGVNPETVLQMESRLSGQDISFDPDPESDDLGEGNSLSPSAYLSDSANDPLTQLSEEDWGDQSRNNLADALDELDERSRNIVERRWLHDDNKATLQELAVEYGISAERIRQLENSAIKKLKKAVLAA